MTPARLVLIACVTLAVPVCLAGAGEPAGGAGLAGGPAADVDAYVLVIRAAGDPAVAAAAFARGLAAAPGNLPLHKAYLDRMVKQDQPGLAYESARVILAAEPDNALARAVSAHVHAQRGQNVQAWADIARAAKARPDDPFVLKTAGELLALYDLQKGDRKIDQGLQRDLAGLRETLTRRKEFAEAYERALAEFRRRPPPPTPEQAGPGAPEPANAPNAAPAANPANGPDGGLAAKPADAAPAAIDPRQKVRQADELLARLDRQIRSLTAAIEGRTRTSRTGQASSSSYMRISHGYPYGWPQVVVPYRSADSGWGWDYGIRIRGTFNLGDGRLNVPRIRIP